MSLSSRPYLLRGLYDWMTDNQLTPQVLVDTTFEGVEVPEQYIDNNKIILNIAMSATANLLLGDEKIAFNARFSGRAYQIILPIESVLAIFASEREAGMSFGAEPTLYDEDEDSKLVSSPEQVAIKPVADIKTKDSNVTLIDETEIDSSASSSLPKEEEDDSISASDNVIHVSFGQSNEEKE